MKKVLFILALFRSQVLAQSEDSASFGKARIKDGDTIEIQGKNIRLWGIDAFEISQRCHNTKGDEYVCGVEAKYHLLNLIDGRVYGLFSKPRRLS